MVICLNYLYQCAFIFFLSVPVLKIYPCTGRFNVTIHIYVSMFIPVNAKRHIFISDLISFRNFDIYTA